MSSSTPSQAEELRNAVPVRYLPYSPSGPRKLPFQNLQQLHVSDLMTIICAVNQHQYERRIPKQAMRDLQSLVVTSPYIRRFFRDAFWWLYLLHFAEVDLDMLLDVAKQNVLVSSADAAMMSMEAIRKRTAAMAPKGPPMTPSSSSPRGGGGGKQQQGAGSKSPQQGGGGSLTPPARSPRTAGLGSSVNNGASALGANSNPALTTTTGNAQQQQQLLGASQSFFANSSARASMSHRAHEEEEAMHARRLTGLTDDGANTTPRDGSMMRPLHASVGDSDADKYRQRMISLQHDTEAKLAAMRAQQQQQQQGDGSQGAVAVAGSPATSPVADALLGKRQQSPGANTAGRAKGTTTNGRLPTVNSSGTSVAALMPSHLSPRAGNRTVEQLAFVGSPSMTDVHTLATMVAGNAMGSMGKTNNNATLRDALGMSQTVSCVGSAEGLGSSSRPSGGDGADGGASASRHGMMMGSASSIVSPRSHVSGARNNNNNSTTVTRAPPSASFPPSASVVPVGPAGAISGGSGGSPLATSGRKPSHAGMGPWRRSRMKSVTGHSDTDTEDGHDVHASPPPSLYPRALASRHATDTDYDSLDHTKGSMVMSGSIDFSTHRKQQQHTKVRVGGGGDNPLKAASSSNSLGGSSNRKQLPQPMNTGALTLPRGGGDDAYTLSSPPFLTPKHSDNGNDDDDDDEEEGNDMLFADEEDELEAAMAVRHFGTTHYKDTDDEEADDDGNDDAGVGSGAGKNSPTRQLLNAMAASSSAKRAVGATHDHLGVALRGINVARLPDHKREAFIQAEHHKLFSRMALQYGQLLMALLYGESSGGQGYSKVNSTNHGGRAQSPTPKLGRFEATMHRDTILSYLPDLLGQGLHLAFSLALPFANATLLDADFQLSILRHVTYWIHGVECTQRFVIGTTQQVTTRVADPNGALPSSGANSATTTGVGVGDKSKSPRLGGGTPMPPPPPAIITTMALPSVNSLASAQRHLANPTIAASDARAYKASSSVSGWPSNAVITVILRRRKEFWTAVKAGTAHPITDFPKATLQSLHVVLRAARGLGGGGARRVVNGRTGDTPPAEKKPTSTSASIPSGATPHTPSRPPTSNTASAMGHSGRRALAAGRVGEGEPSSPQSVGGGIIKQPTPPPSRGANATTTRNVGGGAGAVSPLPSFAIPTTPPHSSHGVGGGVGGGGSNGASILKPSTAEKSTRTVGSNRGGSASKRVHHAPHPSGGGGNTSPGGNHHNHHHPNANASSRDSIVDRQVMAFNREMQRIHTTHTFASINAMAMGGSSNDIAPAPSSVRDRHAVGAASSGMDAFLDTLAKQQRRESQSVRGNGAAGGGGGGAHHQHGIPVSGRQAKLAASAQILARSGIDVSGQITTVRNVHTIKKELDDKHHPVAPWFMRPDARIRKRTDVIYYLSGTAGGAGGVVGQQQQQQSPPTTPRKGGEGDGKDGSSNSMRRSSKTSGDHSPHRDAHSPNRHDPLQAMHASAAANAGPVQPRFTLTNWSPLVQRYMLLLGSKNTATPESMAWTMSEQ